MSICCSSQSIIHVNNLTKLNGDKAVVRNVTFQVARGERLGIFGPRESGKTTIARVLTAYIPPSDGTVTVAGYDVFTHSLDVRKRIGYLPQSVSLYADMTVFDYLGFVASLYKVENRAERVRDALSTVNLVDCAKTRIGKLPQDVRKYVGLAQAIVHKPDVLILDEPTFGLNPQQIIDMRALIKTLSLEYTLVIGTRTLSEAEQLCDRILVLNKGRVVAEDTPVHLLARLNGAQRIRLQTLFAPPEAADILRTLDGVNRVSTAGADIFDIECACGVDCRPAVADAVVRYGWGLLELRVMDASLEDVFLELTENPVMAAA